MTSELDFETKYADFLKCYINRELKSSDRISEKQIVLAEKNLGLRLPTSLRDYYKTVGNCDELNKYHNRFIGLESIFLEDEFLIFLEENQNVVYWGIKIENLQDEDPIVWQIQNEEIIQVYSEEKTFSQFVEAMFEWQFNL